MFHKNIIFDLGGVLIDFSEQLLITHFFSDLPHAAQEQIAAALFASGHWQRMDRGDFDCDGMVQLVCEALPAALHGRIAAMVPHYFEAMKPLPACALIPQLKQRGQRVYLLSNAPRLFHRVKHQLAFLADFDGIFASCDVGLLKPESEIYLRFLAQFGLQAADCLFVDDMQANIDGAARVGIQGHCFANRNLEALKAALSL